MRHIRDSGTARSAAAQCHSYRKRRKKRVNSDDQLLASPVENGVVLPLTAARTGKGRKRPEPIGLHGKTGPSSQRLQGTHVGRHFEPFRRRQREERALPRQGECGGMRTTGVSGPPCGPAPGYTRWDACLTQGKYLPA